MVKKQFFSPREGVNVGCSKTFFTVNTQLKQQPIININTITFNSKTMPYTSNISTDCS